MNTTFPTMSPTERKEYNKLYYQKNKEKLLEKSKLIAEKRKIYYQQNREKILEKQKIYRQKKKEQMLIEPVSPVLITILATGVSLEEKE